VVDDQLIAEMALEDSERASAEHGAQFRTDISAFISREAVERAVVPGRHELPYDSSYTYRGFVDPSGGAGQDSFTLCIAHSEYNKSAIIDVLREVRPPMSPEAVCAEFAETLKAYRIHEIVGDNYAGQWPKERFMVHGIRYLQSEKPKSALYIDLLPLLNSGRIQLLDHPKSIAQICGLERRNGTSGRDIIDHAKGVTFHDDLSNAIAGVASICMANKGSIRFSEEAMRRFKVPLSVLIGLPGPHVYEPRQYEGGIDGY
jgi:hypothetical protein